MDKISLVINETIINEGRIPFTILSLVVLLIIIITIFLVKRSLRSEAK